MLEKGLKISHVYTSPSLRCVQTADAMIEGLQDPNLRFNIEPGLLQWTRFCRGKFPIFMTSKECDKAGYRVNPSYQPIFLFERLCLFEKVEDFYERSYEVTRMVLEMTNGEIF